MRSNGKSFYFSSNDLFPNQTKMLINKRGRANDYSPLLAYEVRRHYYVFERVFRTKCVAYKPFSLLKYYF